MVHLNSFYSQIASKIANIKKIPLANNRRELVGPAKKIRWVPQKNSGGSRKKTVGPACQQTGGSRMSEIRWVPHVRNPVGPTCQQTGGSRISEIRWVPHVSKPVGPTCQQTGGSTCQHFVDTFDIMPRQQRSDPHVSIHVNRHVDCHLNSHLAASTSASTSTAT